MDGISDKLIGQGPGCVWSRSDQSSDFAHFLGACPEAGANHHQRDFFDINIFSEHGCLMTISLSPYSWCDTVVFHVTVLI